MTIVGVGNDGTISVYNYSSNVHLTVDVMGYFRPTNGSSTSSLGKMLPLTPSRILDTRFGVGAPKARVRGGKPFRSRSSARVVCRTPASRLSCSTCCR